MVTNKFPTGTIVSTKGVNQKMLENEEFKRFVFECLNKHLNGEWGNLPEEDIATNEDALKNGERLLSKYDFDEETSIYIITEWDRSATTILFPSEY